MLSLAAAPHTRADTVGDKKRLDSQMAQLRIALEGTSQDLATAFLRLQRTRAELPQARQTLAAADAAQRAAVRRDQALALALAVAEADVATAREVLAKNARDTQVVKDRLVNLVRNDYQKGEVSGLALALQATSLQDLTDRILVYETVQRVRRATLRELDTLRAQGEASQAHLSAVLRQVAGLKARAAVAVAQTTMVRRAAAVAKTRLDLLYAAQSRDEATVAAKKGAQLRNLATMQAQSDALARTLAARARAAREAAAREAAAHAGPQSDPGKAQQGRGSGFLTQPVAGPVSSEFGVRLDPVLRVRLLHAGIDFAAGCGSPVFAAAPGEVILATPDAQSGGYGNRLVIDHGMQRGIDLTTTYNHLTRFVVIAGPVARGQLIAYSGTTGFSTGCHLHFETRQDGNPVNPRLWL